MKARAERVTERTVKELLKLLEERLEDVASVMVEMEETHSESELAANGSYCALVSAGMNLQQTLESMNFWINRGGTPATKKDEK